MGARLHNCATRADRLCRFDPSEIACFFLLPTTARTFFNNKKPGAVTRPGLRTSLTDIVLYLNPVTFVKSEVEFFEQRNKKERPQSGPKVPAAHSLEDGGGLLH